MVKWIKRWLRDLRLRNAKSDYRDWCSRDEICWKCQYWDGCRNMPIYRSQYGSHGHCHRFPDGMFVSGTNYCAEFKECIDIEYWNVFWTK